MTCYSHRYQADLEDAETLSKVRCLLKGVTQGEANTCKEKLHRFLTKPHYSTGAKVGVVMIETSVAAAIAIFCIVYLTFKARRLVHVDFHLWLQVTHLG